MLKSRILLNLALLALVVILGLINYQLRYANDDEPRLSTLEADSINAIEIAHRDRYVVLKKIDGRWRMTRPIHIAANTFRINSLLKLLNTPVHASYDIAQLDLAKFQLQPARTSIRVSDGSDEALIEFGSSNPVNRLRYVKAGERMYLIEDNFYPLVSSQIGTLISPKLLPDSVAITALHLPEVKLTRGNDGRWLVSPDDRNLSADDITAVVDAWLHGEAFGVHDYMQRDNLGSVEIRVKRGEADQSVRFVITDTEPWLILARPDLGIEYHLNSEHYDRLLRPGHLQDKAVLDAEQETFNR